MSDDEAKAFDQELQKDPELAEDLAFMLATNRAILQYSDQDIAGFEQSSKIHKRQRIIRIVAWSSAAAAVLFLGLWFFFNRNYVLSDQQRDQEIVSAVKTNDRILRTAGGTTTWKQDLLQDHYADALKKLENELKQLPNRPCPAEDLQFWYGLLLLCEQKQPTQAIPHLQCALDGEYQEPLTARFLIIAFLETKQLTAAKKLAGYYPETVIKLPTKVQKRLKE